MQPTPPKPPKPLLFLYLLYLLAALLQRMAYLFMAGAFLLWPFYGIEAADIFSTAGCRCMLASLAVTLVHLTCHLIQRRIK